MLLSWFILALHHQSEGNRTLCLLFTLLYGCQANFAINGMHELGHGFVFKTKWLQSFFLRTISFLGWLHPDMFVSCDSFTCCVSGSSHSTHRR